jgi:hypothetical protein
MDEGQPRLRAGFQRQRPQRCRRTYRRHQPPSPRWAGTPLPWSQGAYARDTAEIFDHFAFDDEAVTEQARAVLEDLPVQAIKVGFVGSPENISAIAEIATDYDEVPVIAYMPNLSWWQEDLIDQYLDAFRELLLPQTSVLVGNHSTLWRWLLPDWSSDRSPTPATSPARRRDGRALHPGHRHSPARAVCRKRAGLAPDRAGQRQVRAV